MKLLLACSEPLANTHAASLRSQAWDVAVAHDVPTALMLANRHRPDVAVVAAQLPGGDGAALVSRLQQLAATSLTPVVGLADDHRQDTSLCEAGAVCCVATSISSTDLAATARAQVGAATGATGVPDPQTVTTGPTGGGLLGDDRVAGRILVADDDPSVRGLLSGTLELEGHDVVEAATAQDALASAVARPPDVILLDVMLPDMSGLELLPRLRDEAATRDSAVLLISGRDDHTVVDGLRLGAEDYIRKPFDIDEVLARVATTIRGARVRNRLQEHVDELEGQALLDQVTALPNRRAAELDLERLAAQAERHDGQLAMVAVEIEGLPQLATSHGQRAVDDYVAAVAGHLAATSRTADLLAHWGPGIFVVLLPWTGDVGARRAAERLRATIARGNLHTPDGSPASVRTGIAVMHEGPDQLLTDADASLRQAPATPPTSDGR